ncbi:alanine/glycine:cation symporter family protein [Mycolicibacterium goodii]|uniref:Alanine:cation symporter family protein n=1 Tax=Mycolicibacterium goodii TaxID=134601 RepID=A0ABS6HPQ4_MYCGD|nr:alanine/glycine:cation symporter family protein [Mycolicibacterium goodii]MBU8809649.1 alanine:cation symporter family protein [Mycolicibacterium goodii]MBU8816208.1 alanine:cation symporter family protein [Mycolicibacterium goodii]MBU8824687.1 alanine:cation symporter family protein [Mycolicibacterium goodii]MBU8832841.1 alanine:cation symporter family protein [Mycolicibacterium goodii]MBU8837274.1 alanine:cation symporter family protein [Mycolicibacterium goodii]
MSEFLANINSYVWSSALVYLCLAAGVYFSIRTRFLQIRQVPEMIRLMIKGEKSPSGVSSFQALTMSLAGRIGTGNIAGVATAIAFGGPGALFWMWAMAFLGASTSFVECTLGQIYKTRDQLTGEYRGGPAYYLSRALAHTRGAGFFKVYGLVFAAVTVLACGLLLPSVQSNSMAAAMSSAWSFSTWWVGIGTIIVLAFVIIGGVKRIAAFASIVVPFMAIVYIALALVIVAVNASAVPEVLRLIFASAFGLDSAFGAIIGSAVMWGVKRGIYSNEAGQGTGPHAAAAAEVSHPAKQGFVQAFAVYVDTLFVCSATGFLILLTGAYRVYEGESETGAVLAEGGLLPSDTAVGPAFAQAGFDTLWSGAGASFIAVSLAFFCFTTLVAYYYMAETNLRFLLGKAATIPVPMIRGTVGSNATMLLQALILVSVMIGAISTATDAWTLGDIGVGLMAWLNIIGIIILQRPALAALRDYEKQQKAGIDPVFDPLSLDIAGAKFWETYDPSGRQERTTTSA